jgi:enoyl-CoA hydratase
MALVTVTTPAPNVRTITLDNPARLNSMSFALVADLYAAIADVAADNDCRAVVLTGAGRAFCSGLELEHAGMPPGTEDMGRHLMGLRAMEYMGADVRLAGRSAVFCGAGITNGLTGCELGVSWLLPRAVGTSRSNEIILTGRKVDAEEAERIGLVSQLLDDDEVVDRAVGMAVHLCTLSPLGLTLTKDTLWGSLEVGSLQTAVDLENRTQLLAGFTGNLNEAAAAFKEKRRPVYTE